ncbi:hypothetical protein GCM10011402_36820 [Paracoccus acridae]|uniref:IclR family transcriptional regulator n=2 Tax=Paracoccus TaxID=265 RepID=A0ABQ1VMQ2_9RHOB|nr:helix-turn-helix domain-containing protein [Paracoccus acridae]GGF80866.1 hypothetical protein GCM10011402_36820 [Paracoccus acridae]
MAKQSSSNAGRAAEILILLGQAGRRGMALAALAEATDEAKSSVHRTLVALADHGLVVQSGNRGNYRLGAGTYALALRSPGLNEIVASYRPALIEITASTQLSTYLMARSGLETVCLDYQNGQIAAQPYVSGIGGRIPLGVGVSGSCILAQMDARSRERCLSLNKDTLADWGIPLSLIEEEVESFKLHGFVRGIRRSAGIESLTLTVPLVDDDLRGMEAAISLMAPLNMLDEAAEQKAVATMQAAIAEARRQAEIAPRAEGSQVVRAPF